MFTAVVLPDIAKRVLRNVFAAHESIHPILVSRVAEFDDDVVNGRGEPGIANQ
jgi:hypothetical protein